jgi:hypothetical protein
MGMGSLSGCKRWEVMNKLVVDMHMDDENTD